MVNYSWLKKYRLDNWKKTSLRAKRTRNNCPTYAKCTMHNEFRRSKEQQFNEVCQKMYKNRFGWVLESGGGNYQSPPRKEEEETQSSTQHSLALHLRLTVECLFIQSSCLSSSSFVFRKTLEPPLGVQRKGEHNTMENVTYQEDFFDNNFNYY